MPVFCARISSDDVTRRPCQAQTLAEAALSDPEGVYTVFRTYRRDQAVLLDAHLDRLEDSARREGMPVELQRDSLRAAVRSLLDQAGFPETRLRLTIPKDDPLVVLATLEALPVLPDTFRTEGVKAATVRFARSHPRVKSNRLETLRAQVRRQMPPGVYEGLITGPGGQILEGLSSNFYAVLEGVLRTAEEDVLHGISRQIVLSVSEGSVPTVLEPIGISDLPRVSETFMSSSSRGILPVTFIDGTPVGDGRPGHTTQDLMRAYDDWVAAHLEPIWKTD